MADAKAARAKPVMQRRAASTQKTLVYDILSFNCEKEAIYARQSSNAITSARRQWKRSRAVPPRRAPLVDKTNCASFNSWPLSSVTIKQLEATRKEFLHHCTPKKNLIYFENMHSCQLNQLTPWQAAASTKKRPWYWTVSINGLLTKWLKRSHLGC